MSDYSLTPENMEKLALALVDLLLEYGLMEDTAVYANGLIFYGVPVEGGELRTTVQGNQISCFPCEPERMPGGGFGEPKLLAATFEGNRLFELINFGGSPDIREKINQLLHPYDLYMEQGDQWNFLRCHMMEREELVMKQTISVLVENQAGVLNRITGLFSRRAFNIDSLAVGVTDDPAISRITIIVDSGNSVVEQVEKQLNKLIEVIKVRTIPEDKLIGRELVLLKVNATNKTRQDIMTICDIMGAKVSDISPNSMTLELSDTPGRIDTFEAMLRPFSILEVVRTGVIALQKGGGKI